MAIETLLLVISCGAIAAGAKYVSVAHVMRSFTTTRGRVLGRDVTAAPTADGREGRWGRGGGYRPLVTYEYVVDGVTYTSDRWSYATEGLKRAVAERTLAAVPDAVDVHYDPADPQQAYLHAHAPRLGYALVIGGALGVLVAVAALFG